METSYEKNVEYIIDDSPAVIPDYIKNMSREELDAEIENIVSRQ